MLPELIRLPEMIVYLLTKNAHRDGVRLTTKEMAGELGVSQQTISRWMIELEQEGRIARDNHEIRLTPKTIKEAEQIYGILKIALESDRSYKFNGAVVDGLGTGASFLKLAAYKDGITKKLGFKPFPGTLNIKIRADQIDDRLSLRSAKPISIAGFSLGGKHYGTLSTYKAKIFGEPCAVAFPEMSHHGLDVLEIVSPDNLRERYKLKTGQDVELIVSAGN